MLARASNCPWGDRLPPGLSHDGSRRWTSKVGGEELLHRSPLLLFSFRRQPEGSPQKLCTHCGLTTPKRQGALFVQFKRPLLLAPRNASSWRNCCVPPTSTIRRTPLIHGAASEGTLRVRPDRSPCRRAMTAICALWPAGVDVKLPLQIAALDASIVAQYIPIYQ